MLRWLRNNKHSKVSFHGLVRGELIRTRRILLISAYSTDTEPNRNFSIGLNFVLLDWTQDPIHTLISLRMVTPHIKHSTFNLLKAWTKKSRTSSTGYHKLTPQPKYPRIKIMKGFLTLKINHMQFLLIFNHWLEMYIYHVVISLHLCVSQPCISNFNLIHYCK